MSTNSKIAVAAPADALAPSPVKILRPEETGQVVPILAIDGECVGFDPYDTATLHIKNATDLK